MHGPCNLLEKKVPLAFSATSLVYSDEVFIELGRVNLSLT